MTKVKKVPITARALLQRINRKFAALEKEKGERGDLAPLLKKSRGREVLSLGEFYTLNQRQNVVMDSGVFPEKIGRDLGVLAAYEVVEG